MGGELRHILVTAVTLGLFATAGSGLVALTEQSTRARIAENERKALLETLYTIVDPADLDNDLLADTTRVGDPDLLGTRQPVTVYRARKQGKPVAAVLTPVAPDGYVGRINLLVGVRYDGTISGVRVLQHKETPGLGDGIDAKHSDWILSFDGRSLGNPTKEEWAVKRDGGVFDQFTGATITPRAVVTAVHKALMYFSAHRDGLFEPNPS
jgi:electron transport complex protein RnfG